ncbi:MAG TPA: type II secretion system protein [Bacteroidia bacterium]|nr:type II secretion system protein [Bacteroidia bacterium]
MKLSLSKSTVRAFTLLELLVVISIIGLLAGLMFPAATSVMNKAEKAHAETTAANLKGAISAYFTEYRKFPVESGNDNETTEMRTDNKLMDILLGSDDQKKSGGLNPRGIAFFTDKAAKPMGNGKHRKGITLDSNGGGELWDPYGEYYYVRMDLDYNNRVEKPQWDQSNPATFLPETILIWSAGKDNDENTAKDNIKTW